MEKNVLKFFLFPSFFLFLFVERGDKRELSLVLSVSRGSNPKNGFKSQKWIQIPSKRSVLECVKSVQKEVDWCVLGC